MSTSESQKVTDYHHECTHKYRRNSISITTDVTNNDVNDVTNDVTKPRHDDATNHNVNILPIDAYELRHEDRRQQRRK